MNSMMNAGPLYVIGTQASLFLEKGLNCQDKGVRGEIAARLFYAMQITITTIALPLILLTGLLGTVAHGLTCQGTKAIATIQTTTTFFTIYLIRTLCSSIIGLCTTQHLTQKAEKLLQALAQKTVNNRLCGQENPIHPAPLFRKKFDFDCSANPTMPQQVPQRRQFYDYPLYTIEEGKEKSSSVSSLFEASTFSNSVALNEEQLGLEK